MIAAATTYLVILIQFGNTSAGSTERPEDLANFTMSMTPTTESTTPV